MPEPGSSPSPPPAAALAEPDPFVRKASNAVVAVASFYAAALAEHEAELARANALIRTALAAADRDRERLVEARGTIEAGSSENKQLVQRIREMGEALGHVGSRYGQLQRIVRAYLSVTPAEGYSELRDQLERAVALGDDDRAVEPPAAPAHPDPVRAEAPGPGDRDA